MKTLRLLVTDRRSLLRLSISTSPGFSATGFSLLEMILAAAISSVVIMAASTIAVSETKSSIKSYVLQGLRDKYARLTYFIESEVAEANNLSVTDATGCTAPGALAGVTANPVFKFSFRHRIIATDTDVATCFYNVPLVNTPGDDPNNWAIYRVGPAFGDRTGVIGGVEGTDTAIPAALNPGTYLVAPYAFIFSTSLNSAGACGENGLPGAVSAIKFSCDGRTLTYQLLLGTGSSDRDSIWSSTYPSGGKTNFLRTRIR